MYSTHLWERCYSYNPCVRCMQCTHYSPHSALCLVCEARKPRGSECRCTPDMQYAIIRLEELTGQPLFNPNADLTNVTVDRGSMCFGAEQAQLVRDLGPDS